ncbi:hypothetical protein [Zooshikella sp. RANM57]|uniref:transglycosylase SLT domain-containing protein n=1 Tax=Zooshikella sp. RANM57 TaxID=3425863 RepID=UPI003D6ED617
MSTIYWHYWKHNASPRCRTVRQRLRLSLLLFSVLISGCAHTPPPENPHNLCDVFADNLDWYQAANTSHQRWGTPIPVMMAIMYHESSFIANARPPRRWYLGFIPGPHRSSAYGYAQAIDGAWADYLREAGRWGAVRDDFSDAIDFIGWYTKKTRQINGVSQNNAQLQYLTYHEGWGGFRRGTYKRKGWLQGVARRVQRKAKQYENQLQHCEASLKTPGFWQNLFG